MSEWKEYLLEDIIDTFLDYRGRTPKKSDSGIPLVTAKVVKSGKILTPNEFIPEDEYENWMTRGYPKKSDVVLTTEAPLGEVALITDDNIALAQRIITMRGNPEIVSNVFLKYYLQSDQGQYELDSRASGTTVFGIKASVLRQLPVLLPEIDEQHSIAETLSSLDDKIDLLHRQNQTLEALAETLFRQWFVEENDGWKETTFGEFVQPRKGKNLTKSEAIDGPFPVVAGGLEPSCYHNNSNTKAPVVTISASGANAGFVRLYMTQVWSSDSSFIDSTITPYIYFSYIFLKSNQSILFDKQTGTAQPHIYPKHIMGLQCLSYPEERILEFENWCQPVFKKIKFNHSQISTLCVLRDTLLPKLMSGEVRVKT